MFSQGQQKQVSVVITMNDGTELSGKMSCGLSGSIDSSLNNDSQFVQLADENNETNFISKRSIMKLAPKKSAQQTMPKLKVDNAQTGNWSDVLGVTISATPEEVKHAYHDLAKAYHPDLFTIDMPLEVKQYASSMLTKINIAYEQYKAFKKAA